MALGNRWWLAGGLALAFGLRAVWRRWRRVDLRGRVVLVTGGSRGLGFVLARTLLARGALVAVCGRDGATLERARRNLRRGGEVLAIQADLSHPRGCHEVVNQVLRHWGRVDVLINNAGNITVGPVTHTTKEDWQDQLALHFWAPVQCIEAVLPDMLERRTGRIVNISSIGGRIALPHLVPYSASKFALTGLSRGLRVELARLGVGVTTVYPGAMNTGSPLHVQYKGRSQEEQAWFFAADTLPLLSLPVDQAARRIVSAIEHGEAEVILGLPARLGILAHDLWPSLALGVLSAVHRLLPAPGGQGTAGAYGRDMQRLDRRASPGWPIRRGLRAGRETNQTNGV